MGMTRFVQVGDLHLGRQLHGVRLTDDQRDALVQVLSVIEHEQPDALLITGDVYDRSVPPSDAVCLLDHFLCEVAREMETPVVLIPGNHDSADRLSFGARLFDNVHVSGAYDGHIDLIELGDAHVFPIPYLDPQRVREVLGDPTLRTHEQVMERVLSRLPDGEHRVLIAHAFVSGGRTSESERLLSVGGADCIDACVFEGFEYVAVGHLHRPQSPSARVRYAGSLLSYSASEIGHDKSISVVDLDEGSMTLRTHPIVPRRALRLVEGTLEQVLAEPAGPVEDYVIVRLMDRGPVFEAMSRVRSIYPNALHIERPHILRDEAVNTPDRAARSLDPITLFRRFFEEVQGEPMDAAELEMLERVLEDRKEAAK